MVFIKLAIDAVKGPGQRCYYMCSTFLMSDFLFSRRPTS